MSLTTIEMSQIGIRLGTAKKILVLIDSIAKSATLNDDRRVDNPPQPQNPQTPENPGDQGEPVVEVSQNLKFLYFSCLIFFGRFF